MTGHTRKILFECLNVFRQIHLTTCSVERLPGEPPTGEQVLSATHEGLVVAVQPGVRQPALGATTGAAALVAPQHREGREQRHLQLSGVGW